MTDIAPLLDALLTLPAARPEIEDLDGWWRAHLELREHGRSAAQRAVLGGFAADRLAYAFASGYVEALHHLLRDEGPARRRALCATEAGGGHPKAIACELQLDANGAGRLSGDKSFVTLGSFAEELLVVANEGVDAQGRKRLRVVQLPAERAGLRLVELPALPFVPEIPHARVELREVELRAEELLPGDGYLGVLKPFRTIEDAHVFLALLGWLVRLGRAHDWSPEQVETSLALIASLAPLAESHAPLSAGLHRALAGVLASARAHLEQLQASPAWADLPESTRARFERDAGLLGVASKVRARRLEAARAKT